MDHVWEMIHEHIGTGKTVKEIVFDGSAKMRVHDCPGCETALSAFRVEVGDKAIHIMHWD